MARIEFDRNKMMKAVEEAAEKELRRRVESLRCNEHGQHPTLRRTSRDHNGPTCSVSACCQPMAERATKAIGAK
jgi:hypothetical protein